MYAGGSVVVARCAQCSSCMRHFSMVRIIFICDIDDFGAQWTISSSAKCMRDTVPCKWLRLQVRLDDEGLHT